MKRIGRSATLCAAVTLGLVGLAPVAAQDVESTITAPTAAHNASDAETGRALDALPAADVSPVANPPPIQPRDVPMIDAGDLAEVIVTARRIQERFQDVPISITVFNQEQLTDRNALSGSDLATYTLPAAANRTAV